MKPVRCVSFPNNLRHPFNAIQKPDGEFIVIIRINKVNTLCISFVSADGKIINQFGLKEAIITGFKAAQMFPVFQSSKSETLAT